MEVCKVLLFAILEIMFVHSHDHITIKQWRENNARSAGFPCSVPQPRSLSYKDFINVTDVNSSVLPMMTVLHRCDAQSGCCTHDNHVCAPSEIENVTITFKILPRYLSRKIMPTFKSIVAQNHTRCECENQGNRPK